MTRAGESPRQESVRRGALHGVSSGGGVGSRSREQRSCGPCTRGEGSAKRYNKAGGASGGRSGARVKRGGVAPRELRGVCDCVCSCLSCVGVVCEVCVFW